MSSQSVQLIAGKWRKRKIKFPNRPGLRPTSSRLRETLFNWLAPSIEGARCLDLFAGSGALSWEALSRGALEVTLIESDAKVVKALHVASQLLQCETSAEILNADALGWLKRFSVVNPAAQQYFKAYDIVFLDPPFQAQLFNSLLSSLSEVAAGLGAQIYLEAPAKQDLNLSCFNIEILKSTRVGDVQAHLIRFSGG